MGFFDENLLLTGDTARGIYKSIADLPIIDYHCHLNEADIKNDKKFSDIGELWLSGDHYKWRAMRLSGIDESYITGDRSYEEKFLKYAKLCQNFSAIRFITGRIWSLNKFSAFRSL